MVKRGGELGAQFDFQAYIAETTRSQKERLEERIEAKQAQIKRRRAVYEEAVSTLNTELAQVSSELDRCIRTSEERPRLERRRDRLHSDLVEVREQFAQDVQRLEDAVLDLQAELEEISEAEELLEDAVT